jgi:hypothetical protein
MRPILLLAVGVVVLAIGAFVPDGAVFGPTAVKLGKREGMDVITLGGVVAMGDGVGRDRTGPRGVRGPADLLAASDNSL